MLWVADGGGTEAAEKRCVVMSNSEDVDVIRYSQTRHNSTINNHDPTPSSSSSRQTPEMTSQLVLTIAAILLDRCRPCLLERVRDNQSNLI